MMKSNSAMRYVSLLIVLMLLPTAAVFGGNEFDKVVKQIETQFKVKKKHIPGLGLAGFAIKIVRPAGVKEFKLAYFESHDFSYKPGDANFKSIVNSTVTPGNWSPMIQVQSKQNGTRSYIYSRIKGNDFQLLIVNLSRSDAAVVQAKVNPEILAKWLSKADNGDGILSAFNIGSGGGSSIRFFGRGDRNDLDDSNDDSGAKSSDKTSVVDVSDTTATPVTKSKPELKTPKDVSSVYSTDSNNAGDKAAIKTTDTDDAADKDTIKLSSKLVNLNVRVSDQKGHIISGLKKEDFTVYEEGVSQSIAHFEPNTAPVKLLLLLDLSGSTQKKIKLMKKSAMKFVDSLNPNDQIAVATFTRQFTVVSDFTADHKSAKDRIDHLKNHGAGTAYYDAMWKALNMFRNSTDSRKAIVVLTDGVDNSLSSPEHNPTKHRFDQVLSRMSEDDITIYPIYLDTEAEVVGHRGGDSHEDYATARKQLTEVSEETGGVLFKAARAEDLNGVYQQVAAELHTLYTIAYAPNMSAEKGQWRKVIVKLNQPGTVARTRRGYISK